MWSARFSIAAMLVILLVPAAHAVASGSHSAIPPEVLAGAREYVVSKVGEEFFDSWLTLSPEFSRLEPVDERNASQPTCPDWLKSPRYVVIYHFRIPEMPFVDELVIVNIRESGGWFEGVPHNEGLPNCLLQPEECEFVVDEDDAIAIAEDEGLPLGIEPWSATFLWAGREFHTYAWSIQNTCEGGRGEWVMIDANDGAVLARGEWLGL